MKKNSLKTALQFELWLRDQFIQAAKIVVCSSVVYAWQLTNLINFKSWAIVYILNTCVKRHIVCNRLIYISTMLLRGKNTHAIATTTAGEMKAWLQRFGQNAHQIASGPIRVATSSSCENRINKTCNNQHSKQLFDSKVKVIHSLSVNFLFILCNN